MSGQCKRCGCTEDNCLQCVLKTGRPCFWVNPERDLCSACSEGEHVGEPLDCPTYEIGLTETRQHLVISRVDGEPLSPLELESLFNAVRAVLAYAHG